MQSKICSGAVLYVSFAKIFFIINIGNLIFQEFPKIYLYKTAQNIDKETPLGICFPTCPFHPKIENKLKISLAFLILNFGSCS